jgi:hypothetical protein
MAASVFFLGIEKTGSQVFFPSLTPLMRPYIVKITIVYKSVDVETRRKINVLLSLSLGGVGKKKNYLVSSQNALST